MVFKRRATPLPDYVRWDGRWSTKNKNQLPYQPGTSFDDDALEQLALFDMAPDPEVLRQRLLVEDSKLTRYCAAIVADHARRYGWSVRQRNAVIQSLRLLQILRPTLTAKVRASDVVALRRYDGTITSTLDVLAESRLLIDDVPTRVERYFNTKFIESGALPDTMREHLQLWLQIMLGGSRQAPRQLPREPETVELHIQGLAPVVQAWVEAGRQSFAEISKDDILAALEAEDYVTAVRPGWYRHRPLVRQVTRAELDSPNPAVALAIALVTFHGLTGKQVRELHLADIVDGRLHLDGRDIPLAAPVRTRLAAWLDHRNRTWPATANPHLLINRRTAPRLVPSGPSFPWKEIRIRPRALREDRILHEIHATGGDVRRIYDLFGLSVEGATRYLKTVEHPDLRNEDQPGTRP